MATILCEDVYMSTTSMTQGMVTDAQMVRLEGEARRLGFLSVTELLSAAGVSLSRRPNIRYELDVRTASAVITQCQQGNIPACEAPADREVGIYVTPATVTALRSALGLPETERVSPHMAQVVAAWREAGEPSLAPAPEMHAATTKLVAVVPASAIGPNAAGIARALVAWFLERPTESPGPSVDLSSVSTDDLVAELGRRGIGVRS